MTKGKSEVEFEDRPVSFDLKLDVVCQECGESLEYKATDESDKWDIALLVEVEPHQCTPTSED